MYGFTITGRGRLLLASLLAGHQLLITRVVVGKGRIDDDTDPRDLTDLLEPVALATSTVPVQRDDTVSFIVEYRNDLNGGLANGFWLSEFGIFAKDYDGEEILLYYAALGEYPQYVSALVRGSIDIRRYPVVINVSADAEVVLAYPASAFMTAEEIDEYINHRVLPYFLEKAEEIVGDRASREDLTAHIEDATVHITKEERQKWEEGAEKADAIENAVGSDGKVLEEHVDNTKIHVTESEKASWNTAAQTAAQIEPENLHNSISSISDRIGTKSDRSDQSMYGALTEVLSLLENNPDIGKILTLLGSANPSKTGTDTIMNYLKKLDTTTSAASSSSVIKSIQRGDAWLSMERDESTTISISSVTTSRSLLLIETASFSEVAVGKVTYTLNSKDITINNKHNSQARLGLHWEVVQFN